MVVNSCVYCSARNDLTDEHTLPYALWGNLLIKKGSCHVCAEKTSRIERKVLTGGLDLVRQVLGGRSRHAKKRGRWTGNLELKGPRGESEALPIHDVALAAMVPVFDYLPRELTKQDLGDVHDTYSISIVAVRTSQDPKASGLFQPSVHIDPNGWRRFAAKVAYCEYIRVHNPQFRSSKISRFIVDGVGDPSKFVGSTRPKVCISRRFHCAFAGIALDSGDICVVAYVRFLAFLHTPAFVVHLGSQSSHHPVSSALQIIELEELISGVWPIIPEDEFIEGGPRIWDEKNNHTPVVEFTLSIEQ